MKLKDLGARENYRGIMVNEVRRYEEMMMTPMKLRMAKIGIDLEYEEVEKDLFKVINNKENKEKVKENGLDWTYIKEYNFDAGWFEKVTGLEGAIKLI